MRTIELSRLVKFYLSVSVAMIAFMAGVFGYFLKAGLDSRQAAAKEERIAKRCFEIGQSLEKPEGALVYGLELSRFVIAKRNQIRTKARDIYWSSENVGLAASSYSIPFSYRTLGAKLCLYGRKKQEHFELRYVRKVEGGFEYLVYGGNSDEPEVYFIEDEWEGDLFVAVDR